MEICSRFDNDGDSEAMKENERDLEEEDTARMVTQPSLTQLDSMMAKSELSQPTRSKLNKPQTKTILY